MVAASIGLVSRAFSILVLSGEALLRGLPATSPFTAWDGAWYLQIAATGYHSELIRGGHDYAFFPAWPLLIRILSIGGRLDPGSMAIVAANSLFVAAIVVIWRLFAARFGAAPATGAIVLLAFSPASYVFSMAYSESLFLFLAALAFTARRPAARGLAVVLATLVKLLGIALATSAALEALLTTGHHRRLAVAGLIGGIVGFGLWWLFIAALTNSPTGFLTGESAWLHGASPLGTFLRTLDAHPIRVLAWLTFVAVMGLGAMAAFSRDRELGTFAAASIAITIASVTVVPGALLHSVPRAALMAFPGFAGLALRLGRVGTLVLAVGFVAGQIALASWTIGAGSNAP